MAHRDLLIEYIIKKQKENRDDSSWVSLLSNSSLNESEVTAEILALLLFGHDTSAATMSWLFSDLYSNEFEYIRAKFEAEQVQKRTVDNSIDSNDFIFLKACLNESMRLHPVVPHLTRTAIKDCVVNGIELKAGENIYPCAYLAHQNKNYYRNPQSFDPERFMSSNISNAHFFPFGLGNRICIGHNMAKRQMTLILATVLNHYNLLLTNKDSQISKRNLLLVVPQNGTEMIKERVNI